MPGQSVCLRLSLSTCFTLTFICSFLHSFFFSFIIFDESKLINYVGNTRKLKNHRGKRSHLSTSLQWTSPAFMWKFQRYHWLNDYGLKPSQPYQGDRNASDKKCNPETLTRKIISSWSSFIPGNVARPDIISVKIHPTPLKYKNISLLSFSSLRTYMISSDVEQWAKVSVHTTYRVISDS